MFSQASVILFTAGVYSSMHGGRHPSGRHFPWADTLGRHPLEDTPPRQIPPGRHPPGQIPPGTPPCPVHAGIHPPVQCMLGYTPCPVHAGIHTPPAQCMLRYMPPPKFHNLLISQLLFSNCCVNHLTNFNAY